MPPGDDSCILAKLIQKCFLYRFVQNLPHHGRGWGCPVVLFPIGEDRPPACQIWAGIPSRLRLAFWLKFVKVPESCPCRAGLCKQTTQTKHPPAPPPPPPGPGFWYFGNFEPESLSGADVCFHFLIFIVRPCPGRILVI